MSKTENNQLPKKRMSNRTLGAIAAAIALALVASPFLIAQSDAAMISSCFSIQSQGFEDEFHGKAGGCKPADVPVTPPLAAVKLVCTTGGSAMAGQTAAISWDAIQGVSSYTVMMKDSVGVWKPATTVASAQYKFTHANATSLLGGLLGSDPVTVAVVYNLDGKQAPQSNSKSMKPVNMPVSGISCLP